MGGRNTAVKKAQNPATWTGESDEVSKLEIAAKATKSPEEKQRIREEIGRARAALQRQLDRATAVSATELKVLLRRLQRAEKKLR